MHILKITMKIIKINLTIFLLIVSTVHSFYAYGAGIAFTPAAEIVSDGTINNTSDLYIDGDDVSHICYIEGGILGYISTDEVGGNLPPDSISIVNSGVGGYCQIIKNASGIHIVNGYKYYKSIDGGVTWTARNYTTYTTTDTLLGKESFIIDSNGYLYIAYSVLYGIIIARSTNGTTWTSTVIIQPASQDYGEEPALELKGSSLYLAYKDPTARDIHLTKLNKSSLAKEASVSFEVPDDGYSISGYDIDIAVDMEGSAYLAYENYPNGYELNLVKYSSNFTSFENLKTAIEDCFGQDGKVNGGLSMAVDDNNALHIGYEYQHGYIVNDGCSASGNPSDASYFKSLALDSHNLPRFLGSPNAYGLSYFSVASICGDMATSGTETCDDGNQVDEDGCSSACLMEVATDDVAAEDAGTNSGSGADDNENKDEGQNEEDDDVVDSLDASVGDADSSSSGCSLVNTRAEGSQNNTLLSFCLFMSILIFKILRMRLIGLRRPK